MVDRKFEARLADWIKFRDQLVTATDPIQSAINYWNQLPETKRSLDPYDQNTWPTPWEMIEENSYCEFTKLLAVAYTLKLSNLFDDWQPVIKIGLDKCQSRMYYMLYMGDQVIGLDQEKSVHISDIPKTIRIEKIHVLDLQY